MSSGASRHHPRRRAQPGRQRHLLRAGDPTSGDDLRRAGIEDAAAAVICPSDSSNDADMRSILSVLAIETIAPEVRTVVGSTTPNVEHFERAHADEILVTPRLASRLLARSALYPGLASLVTDLVSGGQGSELYRVRVPDHLFGETPGALATLLRSNHNSSHRSHAGRHQPREPARRLHVARG